jgi:release factor glutamine methyltransferase
VKMVFFKEYAFHVFDDVYEPAEDTFLLAENLDTSVNLGDVVLDMGAGCGILAILSALKADKVVAVDVNPQALQCTKVNRRLNGVSEKIDLIRGDLFEPIKKEEIFDLILFNAPYLPTKEDEVAGWVDYAWVGGETGRTVIDRFIFSAPRYLKMGGSILLVQSTLSDVDETLEKLDKQGLNASIMDERKVAFETIVLIEVEKLPLKSRIVGNG